MEKYLKQIKDEKGVTLVEILAAITILTLIVTAFLAFFVQAADTNNRTDEMNEATFLAQSEMEQITSYSMGDYSGDDVIRYHFDESREKSSTADNGMTIISTLKDPPEGSSLYRMIVRVTKGGEELAHMESRMPFEEIPNDENQAED